MKAFTGYTEAPLRLSSPAKVQEWPGQTNSYALPATREVCTYATPTCVKGCYAKRGRMKFPAVQKAYERNYEVLVAAGSAEGMAELLIGTLVRVAFRVFRIHVSGDFFSLDYAKAWNAVCEEFISARFWAYTRCRDTRILSVLEKTANLRIVLSCDQDNWREMITVSEDFPGFGLSYYSMGETPPDEVYARCAELPVDLTMGGLVVFPDQSVRKKCSFPGTCPTERAVRPWPKKGVCVMCQRCCGAL